MCMYKKIYVITAVARGLDQSGEPEIIGTFTSPQLAWAAFNLFIDEVQPSEGIEFTESTDAREGGIAIYRLDCEDEDYHLVVKLEPTDLCKKK